MNTSTILLGLISIIVTTGCGNPKPEYEAPDQLESKSGAGYHYSPDTYRTFPEGYGYLKEKVQLQQAVMRKETGFVRHHGWKIWAGIMQSASGLDWPIWYSWPTTYDVFPEHRGLMSLIDQNLVHLKAAFLDTLNVNLTDVPYYPIPDSVARHYPGVVDTERNAIKIGSHFMSNGDIMIPTESYTLDGYDWIVDNDLNKKSTLTARFEKGTKTLDAPETYVVTKHMFWPVLASQPCIIPIWNPDQFSLDFSGYAGYETWKTFTAIDMTGVNQPGSELEAEYLFGVYTDTTESRRLGPIRATAVVASIDEFYHHQVTEEDWNTLHSADKASIEAASYWAYDKPFRPGDYLVTVAMHINTKEVPTWALQSVWWTNAPGATKYSSDKPELPQAEGPWAHYDLVAEYGILDSRTEQLPIHFNPYIEPVIHPLATNCRNCHMRAGWPAGDAAGMASYQNPDCNNLLTPLSPKSECLQKYLLSDMQWVIPDHAQ